MHNGFAGGLNPGSWLAQPAPEPTAALPCSTHQVMARSGCILLESPFLLARHVGFSLLRTVLDAATSRRLAPPSLPLSSSFCSVSYPSRFSETGILFYFSTKKWSINIRTYRHTIS